MFDRWNEIIQTTVRASHPSALIRRSPFQPDMFCERPLQVYFWRYAKHCAGIINLYNILFWEIFRRFCLLQTFSSFSESCASKAERRFIFTSFKRFHIKTKRNSITREYEKAHKHEKYAIIDAFLIFFSRGLFVLCSKADFKCNFRTWTSFVHRGDIAGRERRRTRIEREESEMIDIALKED